MNLLITGAASGIGAAATRQALAQGHTVIAADLKRSCLFKPVDSSAFIEQISNPDQTPCFEDWQVINAEALVVGRVTREPDGRLRSEFRLWDTYAGQQIIGQQFFKFFKDRRFFGSSAESVGDFGFG